MYTGLYFLSFPREGVVPSVYEDCRDLTLTGYSRTFHLVPGGKTLSYLKTSKSLETERRTRVSFTPGLTIKRERKSSTSLEL